MKKSSAILLATFIFVAGVCAAQVAETQTPAFALTISTKDRIVKDQKDLKISVIAKEKNISRYAINIDRPSDRGEWNTMSVMFEGHPAPITELYREILNAKKYPKIYDPNVPLRPPISSFAPTVEPGQFQTFEVPLTAYFDLSNPGRYEVTFSRGTNPGQPDNVEVKSNTITITVLPPEAR
ncbi:MAG: hypothetical protein ABSC48_05560 [Terracidiphilus sp.]|jgi:hypothetical protein